MLDILDTLISFLFVILMLSLLVTALVEVLQSFIGLRHRNLRTVLKGFLAQVLIEPADAKNGDYHFREAADKLLETNRICPNNKADKKYKRFLNRWLNPQSDNITFEDFRDFLLDKRLDPKFEKDGERLARTFQNMERFAGERFKSRMRVFTIGCAVVIGLVYRVNSFELWEEISKDAVMRDILVNAAESYVGSHTKFDLTPRQLEAVVDESTDELLEAHPKLALQLEELSGVKGSLQEKLSEIELVLQDVSPSEREEVMEDFSNIWESKQQDGRDSAIAKLRTHNNTLNEFEFKVAAPKWSELGDRYHMTGVFVTIILISFGAPFWFKTLQRLIQLRKVIKPGTDKQSDNRNSNKSS